MHLNSHKDTFEEDYNNLEKDITTHLTQHQPNPSVLLNSKSSKEVNQQFHIIESLPDNQPPLIQYIKCSHSNKTTRLPALYSQTPSTAPHVGKKRQCNGLEISQPSPLALAGKQVPNTVNLETDNDHTVNFSFI